MIAVLLCFKQKKSTLFSGFGVTMLPRPQAAILRVFGMSLFYFAKNQSTHIFLYYPLKVY